MGPIQTGDGDFDAGLCLARPSPGSSPRAQPLLPALACIVLAAACDRPAETGLSDEAPFLEQDSAGVLVATTLGARARAPIGWVVDAVPEYQVGALDGEEPYLFSGINGARQLSDGRVVVLDDASCELRFFGADGVFLELTGGRGEGPGEFNTGVAGRCVLVPSPGSDSLVAFDGARLSFFDDRGRFDHRFVVVWPDHRVVNVVGVAGGMVGVEQISIYASGEPGLSSPPNPVDYGLLELETRRVVWEKDDLQWTQSFIVPIPGGIPALWDIAFDIRPDAALGREGLLLTLGEDQGPEILHYGASGSLHRVIRLDEPVSAPSRGDIERLVEFQLAPYEMPDTTRERITEDRIRRNSEMPLPEIKPVFSRLLVDDIGWLWAELYRFDLREPVRWLVFGPNGEGMGSVDMPPDLEVLQIGRDFVLGVWQDELEVEYVRRHALKGRG